MNTILCVENALGILKTLNTCLQPKYQVQKAINGKPQGLRINNYLVKPFSLLVQAHGH